MPIVTEFLKNEGYNTKSIPENIEFKKILVPIGFTDYSLNALDFAAGIAKKYDGEIHLYHVFPEPTTHAAPFSTDGIESNIQISVDYAAIEEEVEKKILRLCVEFRKKLSEMNINNVKVTHSINSGIIDLKIKNTIKELNPDIIILGTKGHGKKNNSFIGRVTSKIIELTEKPVLAIPHHSRFSSLNNSEVLFVTDFDDTDVSSLKLLSRMFEPFNSSIHCIHVGDSDIDNVVKVKLKNLEEDFRKSDSVQAITFKYVESENVLEDIQDYVLKHEIKIISLTMHKYDFITSLFNPGITEKVLFHTNIPVLVFHT
jgi:nucleotide-binding universal stress UspA family protein